MVTAARDIILSIVSPRYQYKQNDITLQIVLRGRNRNFLLIS